MSWYSDGSIHNGYIMAVTKYSMVINICIIILILGKNCANMLVSIPIVNANTITISKIPKASNGLLGHTEQSSKKPIPETTMTNILI